ncbi:trypsin-1 [Tribolium castaneum]|nr:PREDICTED: trypsin-1 [Tribolium castaneum]|eukprot:XP_974141.2 PREDICTED: trypsin-1 [Tribolium castaneum]
MVPSYLLLHYLCIDNNPQLKISVGHVNNFKYSKMLFQTFIFFVVTHLIQSRANSFETTTGAPFVLNPDQQPANRATFFEWLWSLLGFGGSPNPTPDIVQPAENCPKCTCGLTYKNKRIVGGVETLINEYPWMTALTYNNRFYCGASVINSKYLITAAHCVNGFSKDRLAAVFLDHDRSNYFETQTFTRTISRVYRHRYYGSGGTYNNDIAILKLEKELNITGLLRPVCLPPTGKSFTGFKGIAIGWGATHSHGQVSNTLREVEVPIMSNIECRRTGYGNKITDNMMCAGYPNGMKDSCQGDSGGPLHVVNGTHHQIVGIVSWGEGCAQANYPGVYTRVNRFISWIRSNTRDACYCED